MTVRPWLSQRETFLCDNMLYALAMPSTEKGFIKGLVEFDRNVIYKIVLILYLLRVTFVTSESIALAYMLLDNCVFRWAVPISSGPHIDFLNVGRLPVGRQQRILK